MYNIRKSLSKSRVKRIRLCRNTGLRLIIVSVVLMFILLPGRVSAQKKIHSVFFEGSDYELNVYRIYGEAPGKTMLLIGGIQGDEPGGFISADHYADISLSRGNLIVVPRANFQSIVLNRRKVNEDMNRKFAEDVKSNYETKIVAILKKLISESDCLLNLHDGSGFYSEKWESKDRNPKKYGQSIIADFDIFTHTKTGQVINLGEMGKVASAIINKDINNPLHYFHFNNHKTDSNTSLHKEQRKSATYYALKTCGIPAFGVETSKSLPLEMKVRHHNLAINAFMEIFGIVQETPGLNIDLPILDYLVISINNSLPVVIKKQQTLYVNPGDIIMISHIEANYERGLSADILEHGTINDIRKEFTINKPTRIIVRKDYYPCGSVYVALGAGNRKASSSSVADAGESALGSSVLFLKIKSNGEEKLYQNFGHLKLVKGDKFTIVDVITGMADPSELVVNLKGFVGNPRNNTGEDRGYEIHTGKSLWERYSKNGAGKQYMIVVTNKDKPIGKLYVDLKEPELNYVVLRVNDDKKCLEPGDSISAKSDSSIKLFDIKTNIYKNLGLKAYLTPKTESAKRFLIKDKVNIKDIVCSDGVTVPCIYRIDIERYKKMLGSVFISIHPGDAS